MSDAGRLPRSFLILSTVILALGFFSLAAWAITGNFNHVGSYFTYPAALFLIICSITEASFAAFAYRQFEPSEPLHGAWFLLLSGAICRVLGTAFVQWFASDAALNLFRRGPLWESVPPDQLRQIGFVLHGPLALVLVGSGLGIVLRTYSCLGWLEKYQRVDLAWIGAGILYCLHHFHQVYLNTRSSGWKLEVTHALNWLTDPLLVLLLAEVLLLRRSAMAMGGGWVSACWSAYAAGIFFTCLGNLGIWLVNWEYLRWPYTSVTWFLWLPAWAAFALAPLYQWSAITETRAACWAILNQGNASKAPL